MRRAVRGVPGCDVDSIRERRGKHGRTDDQRAGDARTHCGGREPRRSRVLADRFHRCRTAERGRPDQRGQPDHDRVHRTTYDGCPSVVAYDRPDSPTILIPDRLGTGVVEQVVLQGGADPVALAAGSPHTIEGIGIGSTLDAMTSAYPAITFQDDKFTPHYAVTDGSGNWINISVTDDVVTGIVVRASTEIAKEYCS